MNQRSFIMCCFFWPPMNAIILYSEELLPMVSFEENVGIFFLFLSRPSPPSLFPKGSCLKACKLLHQLLQMALTVWGLSLDISLPLSLNFHPAFFFFFRGTAHWASWRVDFHTRVKVI